jgi:hypothetical protein
MSFNGFFSSLGKGVDVILNKVFGTKSSGDTSMEALKASTAETDKEFSASLKRWEEIEKRLASTSTGTGGTDEKSAAPKILGTASAATGEPATLEILGAAEVATKAPATLAPSTPVASHRPQTATAVMELLRSMGSPNPARGTGNPFLH